MKTLKSIWNQFGLMVLTPLAVFALLCVVFPGVIGMKNVPSLLKQAVAPAILGWGVLFNMKVGNWDFSVGSVVLLSSIVGGNIAITLGWGIPGMMFFCALIGLCAGALVGLVYYLLKIPTIITSIGMLLIYESIAGYVFNGQGVYLPSSWTLLGSTQLMIILVVAGVFANFLFYNSRVGYSVRAVGNNPDVAAVNGLDVYKVKVTAIMVAGLFAGMYAMVSLGTSGVQKIVSSMGSMGTCFDAMMCVFVGMSITRKGNLILGIYCGSLVMQLIKLCLMALGFPSEYNSIVLAIFVLVFMSMDARSTYLAQHKKPTPSEA